MKILILSNDPVGRQMSGLGIRNYQIALELARKLPGAEITLAVPNSSNLENLPVNLVQYKNNWDKFKLIWKNELIISQGVGLVGLLFYPTDKKFLLDFYDPINMEWLETGKSAPRNIYLGRQKFNRDYLNLQLTLADFIVCANERQRDLWVGMLGSLGIVNSEIYQNDPALDKLIAVAPFGIRSDRREKGKSVLKGVISGIGKGDKVLLWNGGVWNWFDPKTAVAAVAKLAEKRNDIKLYFLGTRHPNPKIEEDRALNDAFNLAKNLKILDKFVFFNFGWVDFEEAKNYLLEADIGIATYFENLETHFSHRTRFLDLFWARLPIVSTRGDFLSAEIAARNWGLTVPEKDLDSLVDAIEKLIDDKDFYEKACRGLEETSQKYAWDKVLEPVVNFCRQPQPKMRSYFNLIYAKKLAVFYLRWASLKILGIY